MTERAVAADRIALVWHNLGPTHDDRLRACVDLMPGRVVAIEISSSSSTYSWTNVHGELPKITLLTGDAKARPSTIRTFRLLMRTLRAQRAGHIFLCSYNDRYVTLAAFALRLLGRRVFLMGCMKFDDRERSARNESRKRLLFVPYQGAIAGSSATRAYMRFVGMSPVPILGGYNTVSIDRLRRIASNDHAPSFESRDFIVVARLVPKKRIDVAIRAFAQYLRDEPRSVRNLSICGDGPLEAELKALAAELGIADRVIFHGFLQADDVAPLLARAVALLLVSDEEQFGNVVAEAVALDVPFILSDRVGARHELLRSFGNGLMVEVGNIDGCARAMAALTSTEEEWQRYVENGRAMKPQADAARFARSVARLAGDPRGGSDEA